MSHGPYKKYMGWILFSTHKKSNHTLLTTQTDNTIVLPSSFTFMAYQPELISAAANKTK